MASVLTALCVVACFSPTRQDEAEVIGRLVKRLGDPALRAKAAARLELMGEPAVAPLLAALEEEHPLSLRADVLRILGRLGPAAAGAIDVLATRLPKAAPELVVPWVRAIADITPYTADDSVARRVPFAHTVLVLRTRFRDKDKANAVAIEAHRFMLRRDFDMRAEVEDLIHHVQENRIFVRAVAAEALGLRGPAAHDAIATLREGLARQDEKPVGWNWHARRGPVVAIQDEFPERAARALIRIAPEDPRAALAWAHRIEHDRDLRSRIQAARMLERLGPRADGAVPALTSVLAEKDARLLRAAARALGAIGKRAGPARAALEKLSVHEDARVREAARGALARLQGQA